MTDHESKFDRRTLLKGAAGIGAAAALPGFLAACGSDGQGSSGTEGSGSANGSGSAPSSGSGSGKGSTSSQGSAGLAPWQDAGIDWEQVSGTDITVMLSPADYFKVLQSFSDKYFKDLTGINVHYEIIPPKQLRKKAMLDLGSGGGNYATHSADPTYIPLYVSKKWVDPLDDFLNDSSLTNPDWFDVDDIIKTWRQADSIDKSLYGLPIQGEVTIHTYRADIYDKLGLKPPETLKELHETAKESNSKEHAGLALRGFAGAGQSMYIYPSLFLEFGGEWFDSSGNPTVNSDAGVAALEYYCTNLQKYGPPGVENMNWPEIASAFSAGDIVQYVDASFMASLVENPKDSKVAGKVGYQRWPKGPSGRRVSSLWNWAMPINAALSDDQKKATWLYIQFLASRPTQMQSTNFTADLTRSGVNRISIWNDPEYQKLIDFTPNFVDVVLTALKEDTDPDWRPRVPEWPAIGEAMAVAVQRALTNQGSPKQNLDEVNQKLTEIMNKG